MYAIRYTIGQEKSLLDNVNAKRTPGSAFDTARAFCDVFHGYAEVVEQRRENGVTINTRVFACLDTSAVPGFVGVEE